MVAGVTGTRAHAERLTREVNSLLEKKPTVSLPSALEVLRTKVGDCNEHTALFVALARSIGIPARINVGLAYVRGAFYYHAWPEVYIDEGGGRGLWLPVDPTFNQFPADATHFRLARGGLDKQAAILPLIGKVKIAHDRPRGRAELHADPGRTAGRAIRVPLADRHSAPAGRVRLLGIPVRRRQSMIAVENLVKRYGSFTAVDGVSLDVAPGRDPRLPRPQRRRQDHQHSHDRRTAEADRRAASSSTATTSQREPEAAKASLGFIPDRPFIYEKLTAGEFLRFHAGLYGMNDSDIELRIKEMLEIFELGKWQNELVESFSHGMKQRLVMCAAFLHRPKAVLVDEPMVGLDPRGARLIKDVFRRMASTASRS